MTRSIIRTATIAIAIAALAAPTALARPDAPPAVTEAEHKQDARSPDAIDAATQDEQDARSPDAIDAATPPPRPAPGSPGPTRAAGCPRRRRPPTPASPGRRSVSGSPPACWRSAPSPASLAALRRARIAA